MPARHLASGTILRAGGIHKPVPNNDSLFPRFAL
jgi:hypothetical protein